MNTKINLDEELTAVEVGRAEEKALDAIGDLERSGVRKSFSSAVAHAMVMSTIAVLGSTEIGGEVPAALIVLGGDDDDKSLVDVSSWMAEGVEKRSAFRAILKKFEAKSYVLISEAWMLEGDKAKAVAEAAENGGGGPRISERDDRISCLILSGEDKESGVFFMVSAPIQEGLGTRRARWEDGSVHVFSVDDVDENGERAQHFTGNLFGLFEGLDEWDETETLEQFELHEMRRAG